MFHKDRCYNGGNKHKFEARYTEIPSGNQISNAHGYTISELKKLMVTLTYVKDVCVWCGKSIERKGK